jgi:hypothetical protein
MSWSAAIIGGSAVIGSGLSCMGTKAQTSAMGSLSGMQKKYGKKARGDYQDARNTIRRRLAPWMESGVSSLKDLERIQDQYENVIQDPNKYIESPGYNWLLKQGVDAIDRGAAARGKLDSGENQKDLMRFGQGLASQDYANYVNRLGTLLDQYTRTSQMGQNAISQMNKYEFDAAQGKSNVRMQSLGHQGLSQIGAANAQTGLYNNLSNIGSNAAEQYMFYNALNRGQNKPASNTTSNTLWDEEYDR